jgi:NTP pyrophosphatase (non-canonical NTP hydrolase)
MVRPRWEHADPDQDGSVPPQPPALRGGTYPDDPFGPLNLDAFQLAVGLWCNKNFGHQSDLVLYGGTAEECGEVLRGAVKREQGIRGTREEWNGVIQAEMGDVVIKLASVAAQEGWNLANIVAERWADVSQRDWTVNKVGHGLPEEEK